MTEYVVDASVVIQVLIQDTHTKHARALFGQLPGDELYVPEFCFSECTNVLWKQVRFHGMTPNDADSQVTALLALPIKSTSVKSLLPRALKIGLLYQLAIYDSLYIALAEKLGYPLITIDGRQAQAAQTLGITLKPITDF